MTVRSALERALDDFRAAYGHEATLVVRAPGRVNLIGEHTDYNDGFVLPMALPFEIAIAAAPRGDGRVVASSEGFEPAEFAIDDPVDTHGWHAYVHGTAAMLAAEGHDIAGWHGCLASDIPAGASLSSSAALEVASGLAFVTAAGGDIEPVALARIGQRVENDVMGFPSGIMDQLASATGIDGAASLIDCRTLETTAVPLPRDVDIVIMDTGTRRELVESQYAARRADCTAAAAAIGVAALRDATLDQVAMIHDERVARRAHHVITENSRTLAAVAAMRSGDVIELGRLMDASHASLRDNFEVSGPALDLVVGLARELDGCLGARMTGGGFAGAAVALVRSDATPAFLHDLAASFVAPPEQQSTAPVRLYPVRPGAGASVVTTPGPG